MDTKQFGERIRRLRKERGWEQRDLARRVGVSVPTISRIENGMQKLGLDMMTALAATYELSLPDLLCDEAEAEDVEADWLRHALTLQESMDAMEQQLQRTRKLLANLTVTQLYSWREGEFFPATLTYAVVDESPLC